MARSIRTIQRSASAVRPRKFVAELLTGKTRRQAALAAGYPQSVADSPSGIMRSVQSQFAAELDRQLPIDKMVSAIVAGIDATRVEAFCSSRTGEVVYSKELPDMHARHKYLQLISQIAGLITRNVSVSGTGPNGEIELAHSIEVARKRLVDHVKTMEVSASQASE